MNLSPHFTLEEMTATSKPFPNVPPTVEMQALKTLSERVLEPVRAHFGKPVKVNSGYRSPRVNAAVGSNAGSQHVKGQAADIEIPGVPNIEVAKWIRDNLVFDQIIAEAVSDHDPSAGWTHVSYKTGHNRKSVLTMRMGSHGPIYSEGLPE